MRKFVIIATLLLAGCSHKIAVPREGAVLNGIPEQERVQCCQIQRGFPGCEHVSC